MGSLLVRNNQAGSVPEPSTLAIFAAGIMGLLRFRKRPNLS
ncbi:PEP-CTERM sorting domain-containing protein [Thalassotalea fusca]